MKTRFFDIEILKTKPLVFWSNQLNHNSERFFGNIYFVANFRQYRVRFDCVPNAFYEAVSYKYGSRRPITKRVSRSFRSLLNEVYDLLND